MLEFFGFLETDSDSAFHVVIFVVDWEFDFLFSFADFMELLVFFGLELYIDIDRAGQSSEEGADLFLNISMVTMNNKIFIISILIQKPPILPLWLLFSLKLHI